jgi:hypothetical protein
MRVSKGTQLWSRHSLLPVPHRRCFTNTFNLAGCGGDERTTSAHNAQLARTTSVAFRTRLGPACSQDA